MRMPKDVVPRGKKIGPEKAWLATMRERDVWEETVRLTDMSGGDHSGQPESGCFDELCTGGFSWT